MGERDNRSPHRRADASLAPPRKLPLTTRRRTIGKPSRTGATAHGRISNGRAVVVGYPTCPLVQPPGFRSRSIAPNPTLTEQSSNHSIRIKTFACSIGFHSASPPHGSLICAFYNARVRQIVRLEKSIELSFRVARNAPGEFGWALVGMAIIPVIDDYTEGLHALANIIRN
jgi:hypothetical protein